MNKKIYEIIENNKGVSFQEIEVSDEEYNEMFKSSNFTQPKYDTNEEKELESKVFVKDKEEAKKIFKEQSDNHMKIYIQWTNERMRKIQKMIQDFRIQAEENWYSTSYHEHKIFNVWITEQLKDDISLTTKKCVGENIFNKTYTFEGEKEECPQYNSKNNKKFTSKHKMDVYKQLTNFALEVKNNFNEEINNKKRQHLNALIDLSVIEGTQKEKKTTLKTKFQNLFKN